MATKARLTKRAKMVDVAEGKNLANLNIRIELWEDLHGVRTGNHYDALILKVTMGKKNFAYNFTGKNIPIARQQFQEIKEGLR